MYSTTEDIVRNLSLVQDEIATTTAKIDEQQVATLARHINLSDRIFVAGAGRSGLVLRMVAMRLMHLGLNVHVAGDTTPPSPPVISSWWPPDRERPPVWSRRQRLRPRPW